MQNYMTDSKLMFKQYVLCGGKAAYEMYKTNLKLFFYHILMSTRVVSMWPDYEGASHDTVGFALHNTRSAILLRSAAEQTLADAANITHWEISRIFRSVDAVHTLVVHSVVPYVPKQARGEK